jgi:hypothetical protein
MIQIFFFDLKLENNLLAQRKWQDDFDKAPTGIFSQKQLLTCVCRLSILLRHGWVLASNKILLQIRSDTDHQQIAK